MPNEDIPLLDRVATYYSRLSTVAADLNAVSDELGKSISEIDFALKKLNLGITTWVAIQSGDGTGYQDDYSFWSREIGYAKVAGKWGISLRKVEGNYRAPDDAAIEEWPFNEAPRSLRLEAIDKIPELLEKLSTDAVKTTKDIRSRLSEAQAVAEAVKQAANPRPRLPSRPTTSTAKTAVATVEKVGAAPPVTILGVDSTRIAIGAALTAAGHVTAAGFLASASWTVDGATLRIEVPGVGKKMLALTINAAAEKIIRQELQRLGGPARILVIPGDGTSQMPATDYNPFEADTV